MIKYFCDRCGKEMDKPHSNILFSDNNSVDFCEECKEKFLNWMGNKPVEDKPNENYERVFWDGKSHIVAL